MKYLYILENKELSVNNILINILLSVFMNVP